MWSNRVYSESHCPCGHFDTKIEVVTMKNISARFFFNTVNPQCNPVIGGSRNTCSEGLRVKSYHRHARQRNIVLQFNKIFWNKFSCTDLATTIKPFYFIILHHIPALDCSSKPCTSMHSSLGTLPQQSSKLQTLTQGGSINPSLIITPSALTITIVKLRSCNFA